MTPRRPTKKQAAAAAPTVDDDVELANIDALPPGYTTISATDERREREIEEIVSEIGSDGRIKVWSIIDGKSMYAGDMSAEGFTLDALMDAYGGGDKSLVIMQGKTKVDTFRVSLDPTIPPKNPRAAKMAATGNGSMDATNMMAIMMKSSLDNAQAMNQMMTGMIGALTSVMVATKPTTDPMDIALRIAEAMKGNNGGGSVSEAMTMFREGMQLAERYADKSDDDGMMTVVGKGMDTLAMLVDGIVTSQKAKALAVQPVATIPPPSPSLPDGVGAPPVFTDSNNGNEPVPTVRPWVDAARPNIGALLNASKFLPADAAASAISNMLSDDQFNDLVDDIQDQTNGGFGARLRAYFPADINDGINAEWIGAVIQILLTDYVGDDEESGEPANG